MASEINITGIVRLKSKTTAEWSKENPVLAADEPAYEKGTRRFKVGDGVTPWNGLPYSSDMAAGLKLMPAPPTFAPNGGEAYYFPTGTVNVTGIGAFSDAADHAMLTVGGNVKVTWGSDFKLMEGVAGLMGGEYKVYVIQRIQGGPQGYLYIVTGGAFAS